MFIICFCTSNSFFSVNGVDGMLLCHTAVIITTVLRTYFAGSKMFQWKEIAQQEVIVAECVYDVVD